MSDLQLIYDRLDPKIVFADLTPVSANGNNYYILECPKCHKREAFSYRQPGKQPRLDCNRRNACGYTVTAWDYIQQKESLTQQETLFKLAELAGVELPRQQITPEKFKAMKDIADKAELQEICLAWFQQQIFQESGQKTLQYCQARGYSQDEVKTMGLGHYPGRTATIEFLTRQGYSVSITLEFLEKWQREDHKLVFAYRAPAGRIKAIWGRLTRPLQDGEKANRKYLPFVPCDKDTPFGLGYNCREDLVIVEGYLDALWPKVNGANTIAIGGATIGQKQIDSLKKISIKSVTLALDNDEAGRKGTEAAIKALLNAGISCFVALWPVNIKDPDELIRQQGIEAFRASIDNALSAGSWFAGRLLQKYPDGTDKTREKIIQEAFAFDAGLPLGFTRQGEICLSKVAEFLGIDRQRLLVERQSLLLKQKTEETTASLKKYLQETQQQVNVGELSLTLNDIEAKIKQFKIATSTRHITPYSIADFMKETRERPDSLKTGYDSLDQTVFIHPGAITIIAGRPTHGKTTLLYNIAINMIESYPDKSFFFFSYEEPRQQIALKILTRLGGHVFNQNYRHNTRLTEAYLSSRMGEEGSIYAVEAGKVKLGDWLENNRLFIVDESLYIDELQNTILNLADKFNIGAIFVDYIQKIKSRDKAPTRQIELQRISSILLETAIYINLPILLGAQLGRQGGVRLDNLREAGDIEQDANLVLGVENEAVKQIDNCPSKNKNGNSNGDPIIELTEERVVRLDITVLKNRNGLVGKTIELAFDRPILHIREATNQEKLIFAKRNQKKESLL